METLLLTHIGTNEPTACDQAVAILAVDGIRPSQEGMKLLKGMECGVVSYEQAVASILQRASQYAHPHH